MEAAMLSSSSAACRRLSINLENLVKRLRDFEADGSFATQQEALGLAMNFSF